MLAFQFSLIRNTTVLNNRRYMNHVKINHFLKCILICLLFFWMSNTAVCKHGNQHWHHRGRGALTVKFNSGEALTLCYQPQFNASQVILNSIRFQRLSVEDIFSTEKVCYGADGAGGRRHSKDQKCGSEGITAGIRRDIKSEGCPKVLRLHLTLQFSSISKTKALPFNIMHSAQSSFDLKCVLTEWNRILLLFILPSSIIRVVQLVWSAAGDVPQGGDTPKGFDTPPADPRHQCTHCGRLRCRVAARMTG